LEEKMPRIKARRKRNNARNSLSSKHENATKSAENMYLEFRENFKEAGEIYSYDGREGGFQGSNYVDCLAVLETRFPAADPNERAEVADRLNDEGNWVDPLDP
jgi:hypothetical protein